MFYKKNFVYINNLLFLQPNQSIYVFRDTKMDSLLQIIGSLWWRVPEHSKLKAFCILGMITHIKNILGLLPLNKSLEKGPHLEPKTFFMRVMQIDQQVVV